MSKRVFNDLRSGSELVSLASPATRPILVFLFHKVHRVVRFNRHHFIQEIVRVIGILGLPMDITAR